MNIFEITDKVVNTLIMMYSGEKIIVNSELLCKKFSDTCDYFGQLEFAVESIFDIKLGLFNEAQDNNFNSGLYYEMTIQEFKIFVKQKYFDKLNVKYDSSLKRVNEQLVEIPAKHIKPGDKIFNTYSRGFDEVFSSYLDEGIYHIEYRNSEREDYCPPIEKLKVLIDIEKSIK